MKWAIRVKLLDKCNGKVDCFQYIVVGTVSYHLDAVEGGGHYITNLLESKHECVQIHETEIKHVRKKPDFDSDTVIVALKKIGKRTAEGCSILSDTDRVCSIIWFNIYARKLKS